MKNPDEAIERVMQGLRKAKAPEGMEQRIVAAMRERVDERPVRVTRPWMWSLGGMSVAAVALAIVWMQRAPQQQVNKEVAKQVIGTITVTNKNSAPVISPSKTVVRLKVKLVEKHSAAPRHEMSDEEAEALSEMNAPSMPAPPVPLTEQEKLLVRMVHHSDPTELAMLEPEARAVALEKEKVEVSRFFEPSLKAKGDKE